MTRDRDGVWQVDGRAVVEGRHVRVRGAGVRPVDRPGGDQRRHRPVLGGADHRLDPLRLADLADPVARAGRLGPAAQAGRDPRRGRPRLRAARPGLLDRRRDGAGRPSRHVPRRSPTPAATACAHLRALAVRRASPTCTCCRRSTSPRCRRTGPPSRPPACDLPSFPPDSEEQQACVEPVRPTDGFNWGYDPWHYTTPGGLVRGRSRRRRAHPRVPRDGRRRQRRRPARRDGRRLQPHHRVRPGRRSRCSTGSSPATTTGSPRPVSMETSTCCANTATEHRDDGKADGRLAWSPGPASTRSTASAST